MAEDGSVVVVGRTSGDWEGVNAGTTDDLQGTDDFLAFRLDADGGEIWRYQVGTPQRMLPLSVADGVVHEELKCPRSWCRGAPGVGTPHRVFSGEDTCMFSNSGSVPPWYTRLCAPPFCLFFHPFFLGGPSKTIAGTCSVFRPPDLKKKRRPMNVATPFPRCITRRRDLVAMPG